MNGKGLFRFWTSERFVASLQSKQISIKLNANDNIGDDPDDFYLERFASLYHDRNLPFGGIFGQYFFIKLFIKLSISSNPFQVL